MTALIQNSLSKAQAVPVIGPLVFSPVKVIFSALEVIGTLSALMVSACGSEKALGDAYYLGSEGIREMKYAFLNMATFGIAGLIIELDDVKLITSIFLRRDK